MVAVTVFKNTCFTRYCKWNKNGKRPVNVLNFKYFSQYPDLLYNNKFAYKCILIDTITLQRYACSVQAEKGYYTEPESSIYEKRYIQVGSCSTVPIFRKDFQAFVFRIPASRCN